MFLQFIQMVFVIIIDRHSVMVQLLAAEWRHKMSFGDVVVGISHHIRSLQPIDDAEQLTVVRGAMQLIESIKPAIVGDGIPDKLIRPW